MKSRSVDRIAAIVSVLLLACLGLFTFYLAQKAEREQKVRRTAPPESKDPDYFVDRLALLTMNERGEPSYRLEANQLQHYPYDDRTEFEEPVMVSLDPARPRVTVTSNRGKLLRGGEEAHLSGNVVVTRAATATAAPMKVETEFAIVLPDEDIIRTDWPEVVIQGGHRLSGVGMELDNRNRRLRVDSQVRAVVSPPAEAAGPSGPNRAEPAR